MPRKGEKPVNPFPKGDKNPKGNPPGIRAHLRGRYGDNAESLFDMLDEIARGDAVVTQQKVLGDGSVVDVEVRATISERTTAIVELLGYSVGKPMQVNLNANVDLSPAKMSDDELRARIEEMITEPTPRQALPEAKDATVTIKKG